MSGFVANGHDAVRFGAGAVAGAAWMFLLLWYQLIRPMARRLGVDRKSVRRAEHEQGHR